MHKFMEQFGHNLRKGRFDATAYDAFGEDIYRVKQLGHLLNDLVGIETGRTVEVDIEAFKGFGSVLDLMADELERKFDLLTDNYRIVTTEQYERIKEGRHGGDKEE